MPRIRPYLFYDVAISICSVCFRKVEGKIVFQDGRVLLMRRCPEHGEETALLADDIEYYKQCREVFVKAPEMPWVYNTPVHYGCPYDCGLCPDHEQHSCVSVVEICDACNLACPICYADSGPHRQEFRTLEHVERMLDAVVRNEREPDVVQISGGEPTIHPQFFEILEAARARPIRHVMVNTNGIRLARDEEFALRLATYGKGFELYLQFDSFEREALQRLRGADTRKIHEQALERCNRLGISVTLVVTVMKGVNDHEIGRIIDFALTQPCVRGVTLQPVQQAGRTEDFDPARDRLTLTEVRRRILEQTQVFRPEDVLPVPCHPDSLAMAYALKPGALGPEQTEVLPLTSLVPLEVLLHGARSTITFEHDGALRAHFNGLFSTNHSPQSSASSLKELLCCLPAIDAPPNLTYDKLFRVLIMQFIDAWSFDVRSVKKSCVHIVHPDGRLIPFDTYNLFYRDDLERTRLQPLRDAIAPPPKRQRAGRLPVLDDVP
jgi:uncharacterized radical SAM superfamily Fe-S cluster-containing enzyme